MIEAPAEVLPTESTELLDEAPSLQFVPKPRKKNLVGLPITIAGQTWILPSLGFSPGWSLQRDRIYDGSVIQNSIPSFDVDQCAFAMFLINYDQRPEEIATLIRQADRAELVRIVAANVLNLDPTPEQRSFTYYARTALRSAGLDPDKIPPQECAGVLAHLIGTGRVLPPEKFTSAGEFADARNDLLSMIG